MPKQLVTFLLNFGPSVRRMSLRVAKNLIRAIIFLLSAQFLLPVVAQANSLACDDNAHHAVLQTKETGSFSLSLYLKESNSEEETESEKSFITAELIDFSRLQDFFIAAHSNSLRHSFTDAPEGIHLHKLLCVFLI